MLHLYGDSPTIQNTCIMTKQHCTHLIHNNNNNNHNNNNSNTKYANMQVLMPTLINIKLYSNKYLFQHVSETK